MTHGTAIQDGLPPQKDPLGTSPGSPFCSPTGSPRQVVGFWIIPCKSPGSNTMRRRGRDHRHTETTLRRMPRTDAADAPWSVSPVLGREGRLARRLASPHQIRNRVDRRSANLLGFFQGFQPTRPAGRCQRLPKVRELRCSYAERLVSSDPRTERRANPRAGASSTGFDAPSGFFGVLGLRILLLVCLDGSRNPPDQQEKRANRTTCTAAHGAKYSMF